jgi:putative endonuclease
MPDSPTPPGPSSQDAVETDHVHKKNCFCYILECADGTYYTGWSTDPRRRERQHNLGRGARYTRMRRPVRLVYIEPQSDRSAALRRERNLKTLSHAQKKALVTSSL